MSFGFDPRIILGGTPEADSNDLMRTLADLAGRRTQQQQAQATLGALLRKQQQESTLADIFRRNAATPENVPTELLRGGYGDEGLRWIAQQAEIETRKRIAERGLSPEELDARSARAEYERAKAEQLKNGGPKIDPAKAENLRLRNQELRKKLGDGGASAGDATDLRKEITARPEVKKYRSASAELASLKELAKDGTGASDMAVVIAFMKALDPESVVREQEYAAAAATGTPNERMMGLVSRYWTGGPLSTGQRKAFIKAAEAAQSGHRAAYEKATDTYRHVAKKRNYDLKEIGIEDGAAPAPGLDEAKRKRLEELRAKKAAGTLK